MISTHYHPQTKSRAKRPPEPYERHVNFGAIDDELNRIERTFTSRARPFIRRLETRAETRLRSTSGVARLFTAADKAEYARLYRIQATEAHTFFGKQAARELGVPFETAKPVLDNIRSLGTQLASTQLDNINASINKRIADLPPPSTAEAAFYEALLDKDTVIKLVGIVSRLLTGGVKSVGSLSAAATLADTRANLFSTHSERIRSYLFSALLDDNTCPVCTGLDGMNLSEADYRKTQWLTPIHHYCRCLWVAILRSEVRPPRITRPRTKVAGLTNPPFYTWLKKTGYQYKFPI